jgi:CubicO group peptidase (beta-lactamase class C family)
MTGGFPGPESRDQSAIANSPDWVAAILASGKPAGKTEFLYSNASAHLAAAILAEATGRSVLDYAREKLFDPLGINTQPAFQPQPSPSLYPAYQRAVFAWPVDPQEINLGYALLTLTPRDMLKIGELYLDGGSWHGKRVVPEEWVAEATRTQVSAFGESAAYGYFWWVDTVDGDPAYFAAGFGGQLIEVVPARRLVVVVSTELNLLDPSDRGVSVPSVRALISDVIVPLLDR